MEVVALHRTLEQALTALARGVSLECLVCGEFLLRDGARLQCPECGSVLRRATGSSATQLEFDVQAG
jgi:rubrerythrin